MSEELKVESKWPERVKEYLKNSHINARSSEAFNIQLDGALFSFLQSLSEQDLHDIQNLSSQYKLKDYLISISSKVNFYQQLEQLKEMYSKMYLQNTILADIKKQENRTATLNGWKSVFFRLLTTAVISFGVLGTYYLANRWGIPLPMLRLPT